jgi:hypothetical protein
LYFKPSPSDISQAIHGETTKVLIAKMKLDATINKLRELTREYPSESPEHKVLARTLKQLVKILRKQRCLDSKLR